jgi:cytochrome d ubiquinol oxidase subunit I
MDPEQLAQAVLLSRIQFALTTGFHFLFPPLTIGLSWLIVGLMYRYWRQDDAVAKKAAQFWIRLFALSFAVGVASGMALEFQFGTNWAAYARFVGDIFGAPLAAEVIFTFFLESTFLAVLVLGWGRLSRGAHFLAAVLVALGATMSAFWILVANSWMQTPAGYHIVNGRAELTNFAAAIFNPSTMPRFLHTLDAALMTGAFFMLGISAILLLKKRQVEVARLSFNIALITAFITAVLQLGTGHYHAVQVATTQPEKLAAFEGLFETQANAPLLLFGIPDSKTKTVHMAIRVPGLLSWLATGSPNGVVKGLNDFAPDIPPLALTFYPFHLMFYLGLFFVAVPLLGLFLWWRKRLTGNRFFLGLAIFTLPLPLLTNELGWIAAEVGRQPWIVYHVQRTADAVSMTVPPGQIMISLVTFALIYGVLLAAWIAFIRRELRREPEAPNVSPEPEVSA